METPALHPQEKERLQILDAYEILDTNTELAFDDLTLLASHIFQTPIALISLIDKHRQWFKSKVGVSASETPREIAFCAHAILQEDVFIIENASKDPRFHDNPLSTGYPNVIFYAGAPLFAPDGLPMGTLCVIDHKPRTIDPKQIEALQALSRQVISQMELRSKLHELKKQNELLDQAKRASERASLNKSSFIYTLSHEFYDHINGIVDLSSLLESTALNEEQEAFNELIKSTGQSLQDFSHTVMNHAHIETHSVEFLPQLFSLKEGFSQVKQTIETLSKYKSLDFTCTTTQNVPDTLYGDLKRLNQIILCLSKEAIRFTEHGEISIDITSNNQQIAFTISDTGKIITHSAIPYLFDIYANPATILSPDFDYRLERGKSSCLNLSTSHKLAQLMGGSLELVQSNEISTQFCLKLPLIPE